MRKKISWLFFTMLITMTSLAQVQKHTLLQKSNNQVLFPFDEDLLDPVNDNLFHQLDKIQQSMDQLMRHHWSGMHSNPSFLGNSALMDHSNNIHIEEKNNKITYKIKQPEGTENKVNVSVKDGLVIINTHLVQKITHNESNNKSMSYSQTNYSQSFKLPNGYDPNSLDMATKDAHLLVTFKKIKSIT